MRGDGGTPCLPAAPQTRLSLEDRSSPVFAVLGLGFAPGNYLTLCRGILKQGIRTHL